MSDVNIMQTTGEPNTPFDGDPVSKTININAGDGSMSDVQAGIEFIYHMREHLLDIGVATVYAIAVYALVLWIKKKLS